MLVPERVTLQPKDRAELLATPFRIFAPLVVQFEPAMVPPVRFAEESRAEPLPLVVHDPVLVLVPETVSDLLAVMAPLLLTLFSVAAALFTATEPLSEIDARVPLRVLLPVRFRLLPSARCQVPEPLPDTETVLLPVV